MSEKTSVKWIKRIVPFRYFHQSGHDWDGHPVMGVEAWSGDDWFGPTIHFNWRWRGICHWLFFKIPFT